MSNCKCGDACKCRAAVKVHRVKLDEFMQSTHGKFLTVVFEKLGGEIRVMNGRFGVKKDVKGCCKAPAAHDGNPYKVFRDVKKKAHRMINLATIKEVRFKNVVYKVEG